MSGQESSLVRAAFHADAVTTELAERALASITAEVERLRGLVADELLWDNGAAYAALSRLADRQTAALRLVLRDMEDGKGRDLRLATRAAVAQVLLTGGDV